MDRSYWSRAAEDLWLQYMDTLHSFNQDIKDTLATGDVVQQLALCDSYDRLIQLQREWAFQLREDVGSFCHVDCCIDIMDFMNCTHKIRHKVLEMIDDARSTGSNNT